MTKRLVFKKEFTFRDEKPLSFEGVISNYLGDYDPYSHSGHIESLEEEVRRLQKVVSMLASRLPREEQEEFAKELFYVPVNDD